MQKISEYQSVRLEDLFKNKISSNIHKGEKAYTDALLNLLENNDTLNTMTSHNSMYQSKNRGNKRPGNVGSGGFEGGHVNVGNLSSTITLLCKLLHEKMEESQTFKISLKNIAEGYDTLLTNYKKQETEYQVLLYQMHRMSKLQQVRKA